MNAPIVDVRLLGVRFEPPGDAPVQAVKDLTFNLKPGEFAALVGESGSGKSVTALSIAGLIPSATMQGSVRWNGSGGPADLDRLPESARRAFRGRRIAYVFQDPSSAFSPVERIGRQIMRVRASHFDETPDALRAKVIQILKDVSFSEPERIFQAYPHQLSGGMRQRAAIASALAAEPELLIADEPTTALDPLTEADILDLFLALRKGRGLTILFITHDLVIATRLADTIHVLRRGERAETMYREEGRFKPATAYARALFTAALGSAEPKAYLEVPRAL